jgi:hypothetical protein
MLTAVIKRWKKMLTVVIERREKDVNRCHRKKEDVNSCHQNKEKDVNSCHRKREDVNSCHRKKIGKPKPTDGNRTTSALLKEGLDSE